MKTFKLEIGLITYECSGNHSSKDDQNWTIKARVGNFTIAIDIPIENKVTMAGAMAFIVSFDEALRVAKKANKIDINDL